MSAVEHHHHQRIFERELYPAILAMRGVALRLTRNETDAEELLSEVAERSWRHIDQYVERFRGIVAPHAWVHTMCIRVGINRYHAVRRAREFTPDRALDHDRGAVIPDASHAHYIAALDASALREVIDAAIDSLPEGYAETVRLRFALDPRVQITATDKDGFLPYSRIAAIRGVPVGTVMSQLHRARKRLCGLIGEDLGDELGTLLAA